MIKILNENVGILDNNANDDEIYDTFYKIKSKISNKIDEIVDDIVEDLLKRKRYIKENNCEDYIGKVYFDKNNYLEIPEDEEEKHDLIQQINSLINEYENIDSKLSSFRDDIINDLGLTDY